MKKILSPAVLLFIFGGLFSFAHADINVFLGNLDHQAATDRTGYNNRLSSQFGIPLSRTESIVRSVDNPSHAFMLLQLGVMTGKPFDTIFNIYKKNRKKGWGAMAQQIGIKPGSPEFHALKRGDFVFSGKRGEKGYRHHDDKNNDRDWDNDKGHIKGKVTDKNKNIDSDPGKSKGKGHNK